MAPPVPSISESFVDRKAALLDKWSDRSICEDSAHVSAIMGNHRDQQRRHVTGRPSSVMLEDGIIPLPDPHRKTTEESAQERPISSNFDNAWVSNTMRRVAMHLKSLSPEKLQEFLLQLGGDQSVQVERSVFVDTLASVGCFLNKVEVSDIWQLATEACRGVVNINGLLSFLGIFSSLNQNRINVSSRPTTIPPPPPPTTTTSSTPITTRNNKSMISTTVGNQNTLIRNSKTVVNASLPPAAGYAVVSQSGNVITWNPPPPVPPAAPLVPPTRTSMDPSTSAAKSSAPPMLTFHNHRYGLDLAYCKTSLTHFEKKYQHLLLFSTQPTLYPILSRIHRRQPVQHAWQETQQDDFRSARRSYSNKEPLRPSLSTFAGFHEQGSGTPTSSSIGIPAWLYRTLH